MFKVYWGDPPNKGCMRFNAGLALKVISGVRTTQRQFITHEIVGMYGVQIGKSFVGRVALGEWGVEQGKQETYPTKSEASQ